MGNPSANIRIYVAYLAAYNNGILHGAWLDAEQGVDTLNADIVAMLAASPNAGAEEWAIHDYEGFEGVHIAEYEGIDGVASMGDFIGEHGKRWVRRCSRSTTTGPQSLQSLYGGFKEPWAQETRGYSLHYYSSTMFLNCVTGFAPNL